MAKVKGDCHTLNLLDWKQPQVAERFDNDRVQAHSLSHRISRSVSETLHDFDGTRDEVAAAMCRYLGAAVSRNMLDAYASSAREQHSISLERALALIQATGDARLIGTELERLGFAVIPVKYLGAVDEAIHTDAAQELLRAADSHFDRAKIAHKRWRG